MTNRQVITILIAMNVAFVISFFLIKLLQPMAWGEYMLFGLFGNLSLLLVFGFIKITSK